MQTRQLGSLWPVSVLALGGGGTGQLWGETTREEAVATTRLAADLGITLLDMAPRYGDGEAEDVVGEAFAGRLPDGVRVTTKCLLGDAAPGEIDARLRSSLEDSLRRMRLERVGLFFLHSNIVPDDGPLRAHPLAATRMTPVGNYREHVRPTFEALVAEGKIGAWGITGIGHPDTLIDVLADAVKPAAIQCIANLLDSAGELKFFDGPARPREIIATAVANQVGVLGIRPVQGGALTAAIDRALPPGHGVVADFARAAPFRALCQRLGEDPALLAHRYALSLDGVDTVVLGVKNREELRGCAAATALGTLDADLVAQIDALRRPGAGADS